MNKAYPSPLHDRNPECIEAIAELHAEVEEFRSWQARQNGSLDRMAEQMSQMRTDIGRMDEKLSMLIARQAEDRQRIEVIKAAPSEPATDTTRGLIRTVITKYPLGAGIILGLVLATFLVLGSDFLRGTIRSALPHSAPTHATPQFTPIGR